MKIPNRQIVLFNIVLKWFLINCFLISSIRLGAINSIISENSFLLNDEKFANEIYDKLKAQIGDTRKEWPILSVWAVKKRAASFYPDKNAIYLDAAAIRICKSLGPKYPDALAFIIGHELTHYYQIHDWKESGFVSHFTISEDEFNEHRENEKQADIYGAFIAEQAGFKAINTVEYLLEAIYQEYNLEKQTTIKYPSLDDRITLVTESCEIAGDLLDAYHTANYAMVLGKYEEAHTLYSYVSQNLKFKEVFFNIGMSNLLGYYFWDVNNQLAYNFEIDPKIPLTRADKMRHPSVLLKQAIIAFEKVNSEFAPQYFPSQLHLITAYDWSGNKSEALKKIESIKKNLPPDKRNDFLLTIANFYARNNNQDEAIKIYKSIPFLSNGSQNITSIAEYNLTYLQTGKSVDKRIQHRETLVIEKDIDDIKSLTSYNIKNQKEYRPIAINKEIKLFSFENTNSYITKLEFGNTLFKLQRIYSKSIKTSKGIHIGSNVSTLKEKYPNQELGFVSYPNGYYLVNYEKGLIFKCNYQNLIEEWVVFTL